MSPYEVRGGRLVKAADPIDLSPIGFRATIEKLQLQPNDVVLIRASMLSDYELERISELFQNAGIKNTIILVTEGNDISKLSPEEMEAHGWVRK